MIYTGMVSALSIVFSAHFKSMKLILTVIYSPLRNLLLDPVATSELLLVDIIISYMKRSGVANANAWRLLAARYIGLRFENTPNSI